MAVILNLQLVDHQRLFVGGLAATNQAIAQDNPAPLVDYIASLPVLADEQVIQARQSRVDRLRELNVPAQLVEYEEQLLQIATGEAFTRQRLEAQSRNELRETLGHWGWQLATFPLQDGWSALIWFFHPNRVYETADFVAEPEGIGTAQTLFDQALRGSEHSPVDLLGEPVICTRGSAGPEFFGYNPPAKVAEISAALADVNPTEWTILGPKRVEFLSKSLPDMQDEALLQEMATTDVQSAQQSYEMLRQAYAMAEQNDLGIACEYSL